MNNKADGIIVFNEKKERKKQTTALLCAQWKKQAALSLVVCSMTKAARTVVCLMKKKQTTLACAQWKKQTALSDNLCCWEKTYLSLGTSRPLGVERRYCLQSPHFASAFCCRLLSSASLTCLSSGMFHPAYGPPNSFRCSQLFQCRNATARSEWLTSWPWNWQTCEWLCFLSCLWEEILWRQETTLPRSQSNRTSFSLSLSLSRSLLFLKESSQILTHVWNCVNWNVVFWKL